MQGADQVNGELEVGFDEPFERRWFWAQLAGAAVMVLFAGATLGGLLGRGPFSHRTLAMAETGLVVDYEPVARSQTPTMVTLHLHNDGAAGEMTVFIGTTTIEPMGLQRILPEPLRTQSVVGGLLATFAVPQGTPDALVRLELQPAGPGLMHEQAYEPGRPSIRWSQLVAP